MSELGEVLAAFYEATACNAAVWRRDGEGRPLKFVAGTARDEPPPDHWLPVGHSVRDVLQKSVNARGE
ncbi:MAG: hypothetical protein ABI625_19540, partial [bacterium]